MLLLPVEILDNILSFLQSDVATLKAFSQSHPMLSQLVERHLYTDITIQRSSDELLDVLRDRPHIANYVWTLKIVFREFDVPFLMQLSLILPKLLMLRRIGLRYNEAVCKWQTLPTSFRLAFLDCLRLPSMTAVTISGIAFPLSLLSGCKHIQRLSLQYWWQDSAVPMAEGDVACLPAIDSLALHACLWSNNPSSASAISSWMASCCLSSLTFSSAPPYASAWYFDVLPQIVTSCSHSLTNLDVDIYTIYGVCYTSNIPDLTTRLDKAIPIPLSDLRILQELTIRAQLYQTQYGSEPWMISSPVFAIAQVLKPAHPLKRLILEFTCLFHDYENAQGHITEVLCTSLHSLLVQSVSTINSIHLRFKSVCRTHMSISSKDVIAMFAGHSDLTQFVERGKLILTPID